MTTLLQAIGDILRPEIVIPGPIVLEETALSSTCIPIRLYALDGACQSVVVRPDLVKKDTERMAVNDRLFPLFNVQTPKFAAMCDYIIFYSDASANREELFVLHCELKSNKPAGSRQQLENGKLLADYVLAMAAHHASIRLMPLVKHRGLVFSPKIHFRKGDLLRVPCPYQLWPESAMDLPHAYCRSGMAYPLRHFCH